MIYESKLFERVTEEEYNEYINNEFVNNDGKFKVEKTIYQVLFMLFIILALLSLILFFKLRESYIIRQRDFCLTFIGGIFAFISVVCSFIPQLMKTTCMYNVFVVNVLIIIVDFIFLSRSIRVILYYYFNIFKVTSVKNKKINGPYNVTIEPNYYLPRLYKRIKRIIAFVIIVPTLISIIANCIVYKVDKESRESCDFTTPKDALKSLKTNVGKGYFRIVAINSVIYMIFTIIATFFLFKIKDANKYGLKFECISVSILVIIVSLINAFLQRNASENSIYGISTSRKTQYPYKIVLVLFEYTKGGRMLYTFILAYMFFSSISLPLIHYYSAKKNRSNYLDDSMYSFQYFYKVLNTPTLVKELRDIAVKEFSVENVLFWENYQILQLMVYRYQIEYNKAKEMGDEKLISQYNFDEYYQHQVQSLSSSSMDDYTYNPNMIVPKEILPYYLSFFEIFIDFKGPAVVNISGVTNRRINNNIHSCPTVGIFDDAKNEVVELMYDSIYPILLKENKKHMRRTLS
ncbi:hypothetical protein BCR32DRAFT_264155 [Anaeromyces robustus]|uniref:RGS domain-containing protein n=1 Tax=Anaeromyces robustus TaxID=1754192 RepID=A0A1Y1XPA2_9FUNG|nr:hypothetical protein BCR32DRAFT_264155 [Anaeromyces robustus]|eukprot:ORX87561.1 hypothetical protein BCR32DRAFT_264155 [Anaeromyces robustus]